MTSPHPVNVSQASVEYRQGEENVVEITDFSVGHPNHTLLKPMSQRLEQGIYANGTDLRKYPLKH